MVVAAIEAWYLLAALACPVGMGLMMWFMGRGMMGHRRSERTDSPDELRAEHARLAERIAALEAQPPAPREQRPAEDDPKAKEGCC